MKHFIKELEITIWAGVPSMAGIMDSLNILKEGMLPSVRMSVFCGESLYDSLCQKWMKACPNSIVYNYYGPTEATVFISRYKCGSKNRTLNGVVSIGELFKYCKGRIYEGELLLRGLQVFDGYLNKELNETRFAQLDGFDWYRTGDLVSVEEAEKEKLIEEILPKQLMFYNGRKDDEVKVRGFRVNLEEINHAIKELTKTLSVTIGYPVKDGIVQGLVSFVQDFNFSQKRIKDGLKEVLPEYMIPDKVILVKGFPLNDNGKVDKKALYKEAEEYKQ